MEVYKVTVEDPKMFWWFYIISKNKKSAEEIFMIYAKPQILEYMDFIKKKDFENHVKKFCRIQRLPGIKSGSKIEGVKVDLTQNIYSWKKS